MGKTLILGASTTISRYAYRAAHDLLHRDYDFVPVGIKSGEVFGKTIINTKEIQKDIDTITLYIGPQHQPEWYDYILQTQPRRIIFNPGTENPELAQLAKSKGIEVDVALSLIHI